MLKLAFSNIRLLVHCLYNVLKFRFYKLKKNSLEQVSAHGLALLPTVIKCDLNLLGCKHISNIIGLINTVLLTQYGCGYIFIA